MALLQSSLNEIDNAGLVVDGDFGRGTNAKVEAFQAANGLGVDGIVGPSSQVRCVAHPIIRHVFVGRYRTRLSRRYRTIRKYLDTSVLRTAKHKVERASQRVKDMPGKFR